MALAASHPGLGVDKAKSMAVSTQFEEWGLGVSADKSPAIAASDRFRSVVIPLLIEEAARPHLE
jgi:hypothetical protein